MSLYNFFNPITIGELKDITANYLHEWKPYRIFYAPCKQYVMMNYRTGAIAYYPDIDSALDALEQIKSEHEEFGYAFM